MGKVTTGTDEPADGQPKKTRTQIRLEAQERRTKAIQLRTMKVPWHEVARQCGYSSHSSAIRAVKAALDAIPVEAAEDLRRMELESLDMAERGVMPRVLAGDLEAIRTWLRIKDHRARLMHLYDVTEESGLIEVRGALKSFLELARQGDAGDS